MNAAIQALGYPEEKISVRIIQLVNLFENGEKVRMSKRTGKAVALRELMEDVGIDAVRYFFTMRSNYTQLILILIWHVRHRMKILYITYSMHMHEFAQC